MNAPDGGGVVVGSARRGTGCAFPGATEAVRRRVILAHRGILEALADSRCDSYIGGYRCNMHAAMISADEALRIILDAVSPLRTEKVKLSAAAGRTIAHDVVASGDIPPFANSSMDGYAVHVPDLESASPDTPVTLTVAGEASAGNVYAGCLHPGYTVRIMTGGKLPEGAGGVVPVEWVRKRGRNRVVFSRPALLGGYVRRAGEDVASGAKVIASGDLLTPAHLGILASLGNAKVRVAARPRVNILATGDELVPPDEIPADGKIRNSSSYSLMGFVADEGARPCFLGIVRDRKKKMQRSIRAGLASDMLLITGGVSAGEYDLVKEVLEKSGVDIRFWKVNIRPGKPVLFGTFDQTLVFGLPGNPVSTGVTFLQFVRPAIRKMQGRTVLSPLRITAVADEELGKSDGKRHFLRGIARQDGGMFRVRTTGSQSSGVMTSMLKANCLIVLPEEITTVPAGGSVTIEFFRDPL